MDTAGSKIAFYRNAKKWTQERLAADVGIPQSQLSRIESDAVSPRLEILDKIAEVLDIPVFNLLPNCGTYIHHNNPQDNSNGIINNYGNDQVLHELLNKVVETQQLLIEILKNR